MPTSPSILSDILLYLIAVSRVDSGTKMGL